MNDSIKKHIFSMDDNTLTVQIIQNKDQHTRKLMIYHHVTPHVAIEINLSADDFHRMLAQEDIPKLYNLTWTSDSVHFAYAGLVVHASTNLAVRLHAIERLYRNGRSYLTSLDVVSPESVTLKGDFQDVTIKTMHAVQVAYDFSCTQFHGISHPLGAEKQPLPVLHIEKGVHARIQKLVLQGMNCSNYGVMESQSISLCQQADKTQAIVFDNHHVLKNDNTLDIVSEGCFFNHQKIDAKNLSLAVRKLKNEGFIYTNTLKIDHTADDDQLYRALHLNGEIYGTESISVYVVGKDNCLGQKAIRLHANFHTSCFNIHAHAFIVNPQSHCDVIRWILPKQSMINTYFLNSLKTTGQFVILEESTFTEAVVQDMLIAQFDQPISSSDYRISCMDIVQADGGIVILTPRGHMNLRGDSAIQAGFRSEQGRLAIYAHSIDVSQGSMVAAHGVLWGVHRLTIGRLMPDPSKKVFSTFHAHQHCATSHDLDQHIHPLSFQIHDQNLQDVYDGHHLLTMPFMYGNGTFIEIG